MLKILILKRQLDAKRSELKALEEKDAEFQTREADLETAIGEVEPGNAEQEAAVTAEVDAFEADKTAHETAKQTLSADIEHLETELADLERQAPAAKTPEKREKVRGDVHMETQINIRSLPMGRRAFDALPMERRQAIVAQPEVQEFLSKMRGMKGQNRAVTGAELTIPVVFLDLISENMYRYSKLLNRVRVRNVRGEARQTIAGIVPEAVWTEMCGAINELTFVFGQVTLDSYKVAGFIPVCNSMLEDSDIELASSIVEMLSESVGLAEDKAILYGKGAASKMPLGIVTRLAQTSQPSDYPANAPAWVDLHTTNILKIGGSGVTGAEFWAQLIGNVKKCAVGKHPKSEKHGNTAQFSEVERSGTQENCGGIGLGCRLRLRPLPVLHRRQSQWVARIDPNAVVVDKNIAENDRFDLFSR